MPQLAQVISREGVLKHGDGLWKKIKRKDAKTLRRSKDPIRLTTDNTDGTDPITHTGFNR